jgi:hypothetical protein
MREYVQKFDRGHYMELDNESDLIRLIPSPSLSNMLKLFGLSRPYVTHHSMSGIRPTTPDVPNTGQNDDDPGSSDFRSGVPLCSYDDIPPSSPTSIPFLCSSLYV